jgi:hypothetical protein
MDASRPRPSTAFDWALYRDATLAGLSVLVPIPLLDWAFESFFSRRMLRAILRRRGRTVSPAVAAELQRGHGCLRTALLLPFKVAWELVSRLIGKLLYFLAISAAADNLSRYWQAAFLIDYALLAGHLENPESARRSRRAMDRAIGQSASPLKQVARQVALLGARAFPILRTARRGGGDALLEEERGEMAHDWGNFSGFLEDLAARYAAAYDRSAQVSG